MDTPTSLTSMERRWFADLLGGQQIVVSVADVKAGALGRLLRLGVVRTVALAEGVENALAGCRWSLMTSGRRGRFDDQVAVFMYHPRRVSH